MSISIYRDSKCHDKNCEECQGTGFFYITDEDFFKCEECFGTGFVTNE